MCNIMSKKETKKFIDITPHRSLMVKVGQTGYSLQEALSELIDNSIDARILREKNEVRLDIEPKSIQISDNGTGMTEEEAANSIRLGFSKKKKQLGEFGMGLKTASTTLGKRFTVITSPKGEPNEYVLTYDEDEWMKRGEWQRFPFTIRRGVKIDFSGTTVIVENLKVKIDDAIIEILKKEFGMRFGPFIKSGDLELVINGRKSEPGEPKLISEKNKFVLRQGKYKISGWWAYQLRGLNQSYFGFNTFRRGRLVTTFDKIGLNPNQEIKQITGEIEIEGVPISHDKKNWQKGTPSYKAIEKMLRKYFVNYEPKPKKLLSGYAASAGIVEGTVKKINMFMRADAELEISKVKRGDIIVTEMTRPQFLLAIRRAGGIITDLGGSLCHAAIVSREFNIPSVVGTQNATKLLRHGQKVILDGNEGIVYEG